MPIYLVRWPGWVASLVRARDELDLEMILDEEASLEGAAWEEYTGPLVIDLRLNAAIEVSEGRKGKRRKLDVGKVSTLAREPFRLEVPNTEAARKMVDDVLWSAFPAVAGVLHAASGPKEKPDSDQLRAAIASELVNYLAERPDKEPIPDPLAGLEERTVSPTRAAPTPVRPPGKLIPFRPRRPA